MGGGLYTRSFRMEVGEGSVKIKKTILANWISTVRVMGINEVDKYSTGWMLEIPLNPSSGVISIQSDF